MISPLQRRLGQALLAVVTSVIGASLVSAQPGYAILPASPTALPATALQPTPHRVTLTVKDSTIKYVIKELAHQASLHTTYVDAPALEKRISLHVTNLDIMDAIATALKGTGLTAKLSADGQTVVVRMQPEPADSSRADGGAVNGIVIDSATGQPVVGATISLQGTKLKAMSSEKGTFVLTNVSIGDQLLEIRAFGYKPLTRTVNVVDGMSKTVHLVMVQAMTVLSGVVTTATGIQSKMSVGSDITTINVDSVMKTAPVASVTDLLENRVPGLTVEHTSGTPGDPSRLLLRGAASVYGSNNPIVVVDGVRIYTPQDLGSVQEQLGGDKTGTEQSLARPSPLDQIDINSVATIDVLKGPSASALYGSDAANGVIVITTKKGQPGKTHWSVSAMQGVDYVPGSYPTFTYVFGHASGKQNTEDQCIAGLSSANGYAQPCIVDSIRTFQALNNPRFSPLTSGPMSSLSTTLSGGASALTYSFTGSAQNTHGMTKLPSFVSEQYTEAVGSVPPAWMRDPDDYAGWSGSGQIQASLSPTANLVVSDMMSNSTQRRTSLGLSAVFDLLDAYVDTTNFANTPTYADFMEQITQATLTSTTNATLNWRIRSWLPLSVQAGYNRNQETDKRYLPAGLPSSILPAGGDTSGLYDLGLLNATVATLNAHTTIPVSLWQGRTLNLALGTNFVSQSTAGQDISTSQIPVGVSDPTTFPQTTATSVVQQTQSAATYGWFVEPQLQFHSRFFFTPGIRLDGGTASGSGAGFTVFPRTNFSYIAIDHTEQTGGSRWANALSLLRLRGSFGIAGVQPTPGQALRLFSTPNVVTLDGGTVSTTGTAITTIGNTLLHPERSRETEAGFDAQLLQNRITVTATYYNKLRVDAIEAVSLAPSVLGVPNVKTYSEYLNVGTIRNRGIEMTGTMRVLDWRGLTWDMNGSVSTNDNRVLSSRLPYSSGCRLSNINQNVGYAACVLAGYPLNARFAPVVAGYTDINHDGVIESNEVFLGDSAVYVGSTDPRYTAAFGTTLTLWHGWLTMAAQGNYQNGMTIECVLCGTALISASNQPDANALTKIQGQLATAGVGGTTGRNPYTVIDALRLDAVSLNLTLPDVVARTVRAQQAILSLQGSNLGLWTNYPGKDPLTTGAISGLSNLDQGGLPLPQTWRVAVRITQ